MKPVGSLPSSCDEGLQDAPLARRLRGSAAAHEVVRRDAIALLERTVRGSLAASSLLSLDDALLPRVRREAP